LPIKLVQGSEANQDKDIVFQPIMCGLNPFIPRVSYEDIKVIPPSEFVDEILWCDHSNKTLSAVLSHGTI